jgi:hypothetical protein
MIRHIVCWNFREGLSDEENRRNAARVKDDLEGLRALVDGVVELDFSADVLPGGDRQIVLNGLFSDGEALAAYQVHPEHLRLVGFIREAFRDRVCVDYVEG